MGANSPIWKGPIALSTQPNSPRFEYTDRVKAVDVYSGPINLCITSMLARGTFGSGFRSGWVVSSSSAENAKGGKGTLTINWEAGGSNATQPLPAGDYLLEPQELYPKIERCAAFQSPTAITFKTLNICYNCLYQATNSSGVSIVTDNFLANNITDPTQLALATSLVAKLLRGEETFYITSWRYTYSYFSYGVPALSNGGIIQTPGGPLQGNLPSNVSWLRLADRLEAAGVNGSMNKITITYLGGPTLGGIGYWDPDVYTGS